jgi:hypothetical protein
MVHYRPFVDCERDLAAIRANWPINSVEPPRWAEMRLAAEVAVAELRGQAVPTWVHERAFETLNLMAFA